METGHSKALQTLEKWHHLRWSVGTGLIEVLTLYLRPAASSDLGSESKLWDRGLAGVHPVLLAEERDDQPLLPGPPGLLLGVQLADQLLGAVGPVQGRHQSHDGVQLWSSGGPPLPDDRDGSEFTGSFFIFQVWSPDLTNKFVLVGRLILKISTSMNTYVYGQDIGWQALSGAANTSWLNFAVC